jgi:hypothetical protein
MTILPFKQKEQKPHSEYVAGKNISFLEYEIVSIKSSFHKRTVVCSINWITLGSKIHIHIAEHIKLLLYFTSRD